MDQKGQSKTEEYAIEVNDVDKSFWIPDEHVGSFKGYFLQPWKIFMKKGKKFEALSDISFKVRRGEFVGIIGRNGSGKSTLLKLIAGIYAADKGNIVINGKLVPFLELGVGFNPDLSARENIFLNGTILGMSKKFLDTKIEEILTFAGVSKFADTPIKNFSSGMTVRLAFSIAVQAKADIYLLDEVLAVGDDAFRRKSMKKIKELINSGVTVLYVSHDLSNVEELTDRAIWIDDSRVKIDGNPAQVVEEFQLSMLPEHERSQYILARKNLGKSKELKGFSNSRDIDKVIQVAELKTDNGDGRAHITAIEIFNKSGRRIEKFKPGEDLKVIFKAEIYERIENPVAYFGLRDKVDYELFAVNTHRKGNNRIPILKSGDKLEVEFNFKCNINPGEYSIWVHLGDPMIEGKGKGTTTSIIKSLYNINIEGFQPVLERNWSGKILTDYTYNINIK